MTTDQKIDKLDNKIDALIVGMNERFDRVDERLDEHDQKFIDMGELYINLSSKLDTVIQQTADLPIIRDDLAYLKIKAALNENNISKIGDQLIRMEAKDDYMLSRINQLDERVEKLDGRMDKISHQEYA